MRALLIALALALPAAQANATDHVPHGCQTRACWQHVHDRRAHRWCNRHYWRCARAALAPWIRSELAALRWCESRGDYRAVNGVYSGAYQYDAETWHSAGGSGIAMDASPAEQDVRTARFYPSHRGQWACAG